MTIAQNKFNNYTVNPQTEILILGTFTYDHPHSGDFFFGRPRSFLWHLLPVCFKVPSFKEVSIEQKKLFMVEHKIDFADIIQSLNLEDGEEENFDDDFIDSHVEEWKDILMLINELPHLQAVYFTRKTFNGIPRCKTQVNKIAVYCKEKGIRFCKLDTPARHFSSEKQQQWIDTIVLKRTCLQV